MEPDKLFSDSASQTALQEAELAALLRMLSISEGTFSLSLAICNSPALREYLIGKVTEQKAGIEKIQVEEKCANLLAAVEEKLAGKKPLAIFVTEIEKALPSDDTQPKIVRTLNASRELWQEKFSCPVVFWLPEYATTTLQKNALDFASWISHTFEFVSEQAMAVAGTQDSYAGDIMSAGRLGADQKRFRIAELEQRVDEAGDPPEAQLAQHVLSWLNELHSIYKALGELDKAEDKILNALHIAQKLDIQDAIAASYNNLGLIYQTRGDLDKAEQMLEKSLTIYKTIGQLEGMANHYGNLGSIHLKRGELDKAEQMHKKALDIEEKLERSEGVANSYAALALIYLLRGDLKEAEKMHCKGLEVEKEIRQPEGIARQYGILGVICQRRGDLAKAEQMHNKALEINEKLGRLEGIAIDCGNLGSVYRKRGDSDKAREYWKRALELFEKIGMKPEIQMVQGWINELEGKRAQKE